jgi:glycosyltransferase involved in cell wall biosynthesis
MLSWEFPPRIIGGISRHVDGLSRALARAGMEVDVLTAYHPGAHEDEETPVGEGRVRVLRAGAPPIDPLDFVCDIHQLDFGLLQRLLQAGTDGYDLVHAHDWLVAFAARTLKHGLRLPLVATIHATEWGRNHGVHTPEQRYIHAVEWMLTYDAWRVICCSQTMAAEVASAFTLPTDKVRVVPNGIDPERVASRDSAAALARFRRRWAQEGERILLFVGRLVREKGVEDLIDAMPQVLRSCPAAKLVVAGGGAHQHLAERARGRGVDQRVVFAGFVPEDDLPRLYTVADVAVFPSFYEPFGIVALEAMAAGVPVVASDVGGLSEVVAHEETGIHTAAGNPESLAAGICRVLSDDALAERLRHEGRQAVRWRYGWTGIAKETMNVYCEVLADRDEGDRCLAVRPPAARRLSIERAFERS